MAANLETKRWQESHGVRWRFTEQLGRVDEGGSDHKVQSRGLTLVRQGIVEVASPRVGEAGVGTVSVVWSVDREVIGQQTYSPTPLASSPISSHPQQLLQAFIWPCSCDMRCHGAPRSPAKALRASSQSPVVQAQQRFAAGILSISLHQRGVHFQAFGLSAVHVVGHKNVFERGGKRTSRQAQGGRSYRFVYLWLDAGVGIEPSLRLCTTSCQNSSPR